MEAGNMKLYALFGLVILVVLLVALQSFQISSLKKQITSNAVKSNGIDMTGWTENEKMMYEHHGTLPARLQQSSGKSSQVGSC